jgi:hypothetical protein
MSLCVGLCWVCGVVLSVCECVWVGVWVFVCLSARVRMCVRVFVLPCVGVCA